MSSSDSAGSSPRVPLPGLCAATALALCIQGYHLGVDDAAIYVPAIKKAADPKLYPFGAEFFQSHAHLSFFPDLVGGFAHLSRVPVDWAIFAWHVAGIFLMLLAGWQLLGVCFKRRRAKWSGVILLAVLLGVPVAGTALFIADPYVTARTLSTPATLFAIAAFAEGRHRQAYAWLAATALVHLQMSVYCGCFLVCFALTRQRASVTVREEAPLAKAACYAALPFFFALEPAHGPAREALLSRTYFFVSKWAWYEWFGVFAPLAILWWLSTAPVRGTRSAFQQLSHSLVPFGLTFAVAAVALNASPRLENYTRLQPMRALHLLYVVFFLMLGGLIGEYLLQKGRWRWPAVFGPLAAGMCLLQLVAYPASAHIEWPGARQQNAWTAAFLWIRSATPKDAVFALDPSYMTAAGEDMHGFRAVAERSVLADAVKDSGAVSLFPDLAERWKSQVDAVTDWRCLRRSELDAVAARYPVTWIVVAGNEPPGLTCPYRNGTVSVCRIEPLLRSER
jgi:hypothetical protein